MRLNIYKMWLNANKMRLNIKKMGLNTSKMRLKIYKMWQNTNKMRLNANKMRLNINKVRLNTNKMRLNINKLRLNTYSKSDWILHHLSNHMASSDLFYTFHFYILKSAAVWKRRFIKYKKNEQLFLP